MSAWLTQQKAAFALAMRRLAGAPTTTLLAALSIGIALALPAGGQLLLNSLQQFGQGSSATPQISVFMALDANDKQATAVGNQLKAHAGIASIQFVSREDTQKRLRGGGLAQIIDSLPKNPFPDTFIVNPHDTTPAALESLRTELGKLTNVEHVQLDSAWARRLAALLQLGRTVVALLAILFGVGLVALIFNTIRLQVLTQGEEIEVSRLLGATDAYIGRPFFYFGALQGLFGGLIACAIVYGGFAYLQGPVTELTRLYNLDFALKQLRILDAAGLLAVSALLGWAGATLSVRRHLLSF